MAYYSALIAAWNNGASTLPSGAAGTLFVGGDTTQQKLDKLNAWTVTGSIPTSFFCTGDQIANCIDKTEFLALTATQQANLLALCQIPGQLLGGSGNTSHLVPGMILAYFTNVVGPTILALTALAKATVLPWSQTAGYGTTPIGTADLTLAGLS